MSTTHTHLPTQTAGSAGVMERTGVKKTGITFGNDQVDECCVGVMQMCKCAEVNVDN